MALNNGDPRAAIERALRAAGVRNVPAVDYDGYLGNSDEWRRQDPYNRSWRPTPYQPSQSIDEIAETLGVSVEEAVKMYDRREMTGSSGNFDFDAMMDREESAVTVSGENKYGLDKVGKPETWASPPVSAPPPSVQAPTPSPAPNALTKDDVVVDHVIDAPPVSRAAVDDIGDLEAAIQDMPDLDTVDIGPGRLADLASPVDLNQAARIGAMMDQPGSLLGPPSTQTGVPGTSVGAAPGNIGPQTGLGGIGAMLGISSAQAAPANNESLVDIAMNGLRGMPQSVSRDGITGRSFAQPGLGIAGLRGDPSAAMRSSNFSTMGLPAEPPSVTTS